MNFAIRKRLEKLENRPEPKDDDDNFNLSPPTSPPRSPPLGTQHPRVPLGPPPAPPLFPPPLGRFLEPSQPPTAQPRPSPPLKPKGFIYVPPTPSAPPLSPGGYIFLGPSGQSVLPAPRPLIPTAPPRSSVAFIPSNNLYGSQKQTLAREKEEIKNAVQKELDDKIYEMPVDPPKLELGDGLGNILRPEAEDILDEEFLNKKELEDEVLENIKEEYGFEEIKDVFDEASFLTNLNFSMAVSAKTLFRHVTFCHLITQT